MEAEIAAGFAVVVACLLAILILVFASRAQIEKNHRQGPGEENENRGDSR